MAMNKSANNGKIACPDCGSELELLPKPGNPKRLIATHNCFGRGSRQVYETDARNYVPLGERIQPSEGPTFLQKEEQDSKNKNLKRS